MTSTDITLSISLLIFKLKSVETLGYGNHADCGLGDYQAKMPDIADEIEGPVLSSYRRRTRIGR